MEIWPEKWVKNASHMRLVIVACTTDSNRICKHKHRTMMSKTVDIMLRNSLLRPRISLSTDKRLVWRVFQRSALLVLECTVQSSKKIDFFKPFEILLHPATPYLVNKTIAVWFNNFHFIGQ